MYQELKATDTTQNNVVAYRNGRSQPTPPPNLEAKKLFSLLAREEGQVFEIRGVDAMLVEDKKPYSKPRIISGYFNDADKLASTITQIDPNESCGVYITINPCKSAMLSKAVNRLRGEKGISTTADAEIAKRQILFLDCDPEREGGIKAIPTSDSEHRTAMDFIEYLIDSLTQLGWPEPIEIDSGNGAYALYAIDLPADDGGLIQRVLAGLADKFDTEAVHIDQTTYNLSRIMRVPGTWNRKADSTEERPHRIAHIDSAPEVLEVVSRELLEVVATPAEPEKVTQATSQKVAEIGTRSKSGTERLTSPEDFLKRNGIQHEPVKTDRFGKRIWILSNGCVFNSAHSGKDAAVTQLPDGTFGYNCFHDHCATYKWADFAKHVEPGYMTSEEKNAAYEAAQAAKKTVNKPVPPKTKTVRAPAPPAPVRKGPDTGLCKYDADDSGNGDAMHELFGTQLLWCGSRGWFHYTGTHWELDREGAMAKKLAVETLRQRRHAAVDQRVEDIIKCTKADDGRVNGCVSRFKTLVDVKIDDFDNNPDMLNCQNGVLDFRSGAVEPHCYLQRFTYCVPVRYDANEQVLPEWLEYLNNVVGGGQSVIDYLQEALGYSLTGRTNEECLFYIYGPTRSGKGTLEAVIKALLPSPLYAGVDFNTFTAKREGDTSNFDLAPLKACRLIVASESNEYQSLNPAKIKSLTGGDDVWCCFKHKDHFSYKPQYKVWMQSNQPVNGNPDDSALWTRVRVIEFPNSYAGKEDKSKKARLVAPEALPGILTWFVQGAIKWYKRGASGLNAPSQVVKATNDHRAALDFVQQWIDACCEPAADNLIPNEQIMASYKAWCDNNSVTAKKSKGLTQSLKAKGYQAGVNGKATVKGKPNQPVRGVKGLKIKVTDATELWDTKSYGYESYGSNQVVPHVRNLEAIKVDSSVTSVTESYETASSAELDTISKCNRKNNQSVTDADRMASSAESDSTLQSVTEKAEYVTSVTDIAAAQQIFDDFRACPGYGLTYKDGGVVIQAPYDLSNEEFDALAEKIDTLPQPIYEALAQLVQSSEDLA